MGVDVNPSGSGDPVYHAFCNTCNWTGPEGFSRDAALRQNDAHYASARHRGNASEAAGRSDARRGLKMGRG